MFAPSFLWLNSCFMLKYLPRIIRITRVVKIRIILLYIYMDRNAMFHDQFEAILENDYVSGVILR